MSSHSCLWITGQLERGLLFLVLIHLPGLLHIPPTAEKCSVAWPVFRDNSISNNISSDPSSIKFTHPRSPSPLPPSLAASSKIIHGNRRGSDSDRRQPWNETTRNESPREKRARAQFCLAPYHDHANLPHRTLTRLSATCASRARSTPSDVRLRGDSRARLDRCALRPPARRACSTAPARRAERARHAQHFARASAAAAAAVRGHFRLHCRPFITDAPAHARAARVDRVGALAGLLFARALARALAQRRLLAFRPVARHRLHSLLPLLCLRLPDADGGVLEPRAAAREQSRQRQRAERRERRRGRRRWWWECGCGRG